MGAFAWGKVTFGCSHLKPVVMNQTQPDKFFTKMPSLRAVKVFVAAARYKNFTRAAQALCVTQAAVSRQVRELEQALGVKLFRRDGRSVELTEAGSIFYDAAYLSFLNISDAAKRIEGQVEQVRELTVCCSPAFSAFWLAPRLPAFFDAHPDIDLNVVATNRFLEMEPGVYPDVFISKANDPREGYQSVPLFHDWIYPVCAPDYLAENPGIETLEGLEQSDLLNLSPYGRSQVAEHVDWRLWFARLGRHFDNTIGRDKHLFNANDYVILLHMAQRGQGVCLGWHHLVAPLIDAGALVRVGSHNTHFHDKLHFLSYSEDSQRKLAFRHFIDWLRGEIAREPTVVMPSGES